MFVYNLDYIFKQLLVFNVYSLPLFYDKRAARMSVIFREFFSFILQFLAPFFRSLPPTTVRFTKF